jgi:hypothetical protein
MRRFGSLENELVAALYRNIGSIKPRTEFVTKYEFDDHSYSYSHDSRTDFGFLTLWDRGEEKNDDVLNAIDAYGETLSTVHGIWKKEDGEYNKIRARKHLLSFLREVANSYPKKPKDLYGIRKMFDDFLIEHLEPQYQFYVPLFGIEPARDEYTFDEALKIIRLPTIERNFYGSFLLSGPFTKFSIEDFLDTPYWLLASCMDPSESSAMQKRIARALSSLRLSAPGSIGSRLGFSKHRRPRYRFSGAFSIKDYGDYSLPQRNRIHYPRDYQIDANWKRAAELFQGLGKQEVWDEVSGAIARFNYSYQRESEEDAIVDLAIALEALLLRESEFEKGYQIGVRGSQLLKSREIGADAAYQRIRGVNALRNKVVHANKQLRTLKPKDFYGVDRKAVRTSAQEIVREVILEYIRRLSEGETVKSINLSLDHAARGYLV